MAYSQADVDSLEKAIASGVLTVRHGDVMTTYRTLAEMKEILSTMKAELQSGGRVKRTVPVFSDGVVPGHLSGPGGIFPWRR